MDADEPLVADRPARPDWGLALRIGWIAARVIAVFYLGQQGATFFYQGF